MELLEKYSQHIKWSIMGETMVEKYNYGTLPDETRRFFNNLEKNSDVYKKMCENKGVSYNDLHQLLEKLTVKDLRLNLKKLKITFSEIELEDVEILQTNLGKECNVTTAQKLTIKKDVKLVENQKLIIMFLKTNEIQLEISLLFLSNNMI